MKVLQELLPGCFLLQPQRFEDNRGVFVKTYHENLFQSLGVSLEIREEFYSFSRRDVLRGMHFQLPPHAHDKLVYCAQGTVKDVLLDLRKGAGYGRVAVAELSGENAHLILIPKGIAHGFVVLSDEALMLYKTSMVYMPQADGGIRWDSFGFDWGIAAPILSGRDQQHSALADFVSPF
jgi:dTDP-4-dehydrorhamnose 3,5-epimerase/CDP-3, 6-dideoxy-D-glycero-D-glycero-4-hexulose-5-epimerase